jgi:protocatechuate 3,4-dioxygenase beta subunit
MEDTKTLLFYLVSIAGLIVVSILFTGQIEQPELEPSQPAPVTSTVTRLKSTAKPLESNQEVCSSTNQIAFYRPDTTHLEGNRLVISGTVYASDFVTPLPSAPIEVWLVAQETQYDPNYPPYNAFHDWFQTDKAGHYEATTPKPGHSGIIYLHYRANDQDECPLTIQLFFVDDSTLGDTASVSSGLMKQTEITSSVLQGPIDVVLSVPSPKP